MSLSGGHHTSVVGFLSWCIQYQSRRHKDWTTQVGCDASIGPVCEVVWNTHAMLNVFSEVCWQEHRPVGVHTYLCEFPCTHIHWWPSQADFSAQLYPWVIMHDRHLHVFKSVQQGFKIHVFDVSSSKAGVWGANDTVPKDFGRNHVSCACCEFEWVIN